MSHPWSFEQVLDTSGEIAVRGGRSAPSAKRRFYKRLLLGLLLLAFLTSVLLPAALPPNEGFTSKSLYCGHCGLRKHTLETWQGDRSNQAETSELLVTPLSTWRDSHYPDPCSHEWHANRVDRGDHFRLGTFRTRAGGAHESGFGPTPRLIRLSETDRIGLDRRFEADPAACKAYVRSRLIKNDRDLPFE